MTDSKEWNWEAVEKESWLNPSEESYYYAEKWKREGRKSVLDLGCGLGRHSVLFDAAGFDVKALDLSDYGIAHLKEWQKKTGRAFPARTGDMKNLPYGDGEFDAIYAYHVLSHTDKEGFRVILSEISRVLRPGGEIYFDVCSKASDIFKGSGFPHADEDTLIFQGGAEDGIPHLYFNENDLRDILTGFAINRMRHIFDIATPLTKGGGVHYYVEAERL